MSRQGKPRHTGLPHNPNVRDTISDKLRWSSPPKIEDLKQGFRGWHERGYLPHRDEPGLTQFITFRLADSFPNALRFEWEHLWKIEDDYQRRAELEAYLDSGRGECYLHQPTIAGIVEDALRFFHGQRYALLAWVVMPNHVHALLKVEAAPLAAIVASWKKFSGQKANRLLGRRGAFWQRDYWDTYMRNKEQELETRQYIENNPVKPGLTLDPKTWPWSSAQHRDESGELHL